MCGCFSFSLVSYQCRLGQVFSQKKNRRKKQKLISLRQAFAKSSRCFLGSEENVVPNNIVVRIIILNKVFPHDGKGYDIV